MIRRWGSIPYSHTLVVDPRCACAAGGVWAWNAAEPLPNWREFISKTEPQLDATGQPFLRVREKETTTQIGICRDNALRMSAPPQLVEGLLFARLEQELKSKKPAHASEQQIQSDFKLLQEVTKSREAALATGVLEGTE